MSAAADVPEAVILHADRRELLQRRKLRQRRERDVIHVLAPHAEAAQTRHLRERDETTAAEVRTLPAPEVFERPRCRERLEPLIRRNSLLSPEPLQSWNRGEVLHRDVVAQGAVRPEHAQIR